VAANRDSNLILAFTQLLAAIASRHQFGFDHRTANIGLYRPPDITLSETIN